jgi:hypothetical protein
MAAWLMGDVSVSTASASSALPVQLTTTTARCATHFATGQTAAAGSLSAAALRLAQGVLMTMLLKKLTIAGCVLLSLGGVGVGGGALLVRASRAQEPKPATVAAPVQPRQELAVIFDTTQRDELDPQLKELLEAARQRADAQRAFYEEGRITIDRFIDGLAHLEKVQLIAARTDSERMAIRQRHVNLLEEILNRENAELQVGRGTMADVSEARQRHLEAKYEMKNSEKEAAEKSAILRRLSEIERKLEQLQRDRTGKPAGNP